MNWLNYTSTEVPSFSIKEKVEKKDLLRGSVVAIFNNIEQFYSLCSELENRIFGIILLEEYMLIDSQKNSQLVFLPLSMLNGADTDTIKNILTPIVNNIEQNRVYTSKSARFYEELIKSRNELDQVTKNYYISSKKLETFARQQIDRKEFVLKQTQNLAKVTGFSYSMKNKEITLLDNFEEIFEENEIQMDLINGINVLSNDQNIALLRKIEETINDRPSEPLEFCIKNHTKCVLIQLRLLKEESNSVVVGIIQDITRRKTLEAEKMEEKEKAIISSKLAALGQMSAGIAHEINTPLSVLLNQNTLIQRILKQSNIENEKLDKVLNRSTLTIEKISKIIKGMKSLSRKESSCEKQFIKLNQLLLDVKNTVTEDLIENQIHFDFEIEKELQETTFKLPETQIYQILVNLITNSKDAISDLPKKWIKINISKSKGEKIAISVSDSGKGIKLEDQEKIFNPFYTTKDIGHGTGLGLSLSKSLAINFGGDLLINDHAKNTQFDLIIPKEL